MRGGTARPIYQSVMRAGHPYVLIEASEPWMDRF
jgi:hypothetical protein